MIYDAKNFKWDTFLKFREQTGMQKISNELKTTGEKVFLKTTWEQLHIENDAKLHYSWGFKENVLQEKFTFAGISFVTETTFTDEQRLLFYGKWLEIAVPHDIHMIQLKTDVVSNKNVAELFLRHIDEQLSALFKAYTYINKTRDYIGVEIRCQMKMDGPKLHLLIMPNGQFGFHDMPYEDDIPDFIRDKELTNEVLTENKERLEKIKLFLIELLSNLDMSSIFGNK